MTEAGMMEAGMRYDVIVVGGGSAGLRVADASVMPLDCRANTHFTCVMIGTMAARLITRDRAIVAG